MKLSSLPKTQTEDLNTHIVQKLDKLQIEPEKRWVSTGFKHMTFEILVQTPFRSLEYEASDNGSWSELHKT